MSNITAAAVRRSPTRIVLVAAALVAAFVVAVVFFAHPLNRPQPPIRTAALTAARNGAPSIAPSPSPAPGAVPTAAPVAAPAANTVKFGCVSTAFGNSKAPLSAFVDAVRTGAHTGYDRLTIEFQNGEPSSIEIKPQSGTTFTASPSGQSVTVLGQAGILVIIHG